MMNIICWTIIIIFGLLYVVCLLGTLISVKDESKNSYLLLLTLFFVLIGIFPVKEIYSSEIAITVWKICFLIEAIASLLTIFLSREGRYNSIIVFVISLPLTVLPFYNSFELSEDKTPISLASNTVIINIEYLLTIIGVVSAVVLIICSVITAKRISSLKSSSKLSNLLQQNISALSREDSFRRPMDTLWSYEANSKLRQLDLEIKQCIAEIHKLSQKPFLPSNVYSASIDELRPMIYSMSAEISKLKNIVTKNETQYAPPSDFSIMTELNHSLATPLSQIEVNCQLLKAKTKGNANSNLDKIVQYVNFCRRTILAYKELLSSTFAGDGSDYKDIIQDCFKMYYEKHGKDKLSIRFESDDKLAISRNIIMSLVSPLLENAVTASPEEKEIVIDIGIKEDCIEMSISNFCNQVPKESDLQTSGYSSKPNHIGTGLDTVRHLLSLIGGKELKSTISKNNIRFTIQLPKECGQIFQK